MSHRRSSLLPRYCHARVSDETSDSRKKASQFWFVPIPKPKRKKRKHGNPGAAALPSPSGIRPLISRLRQPAPAKPGHSKVFDKIPVRSGVDASSGEHVDLKRLITRSHVLRADQRYEELEATLKLALLLTEKLFPPESQRVAEGLENYAAALRLLQRHDEARQFKSRAAMIRAKLSSPVRSDAPPQEQQPTSTSAPPKPSSAEGVAARRNESVRAEDLLHAKSAIVRLEEYMIWESLTPDWSDRRQEWVRQVCHADTVEDLSRLVAELESHLFWEYGEKGWDSVRDEWLSRCESVSGIGSLGEILILLEEHVARKAFQAGWIEDRIHWGRTVRWLCSE